MHSRWIAVRKNGNTTFIGHREIALANNVHTDQNIGIGSEYCLSYLQMHETNLVRQADVDEVNLSIHFAVSGLHLCHADGRQTTLVNDVLRDCGRTRTRVPNCRKWRYFRRLAARRRIECLRHMARRLQYREQPALGCYGKAFGVRVKWLQLAEGSARVKRLRIRRLTGRHFLDKKCPQLMVFLCFGDSGKLIIIDANNFGVLYHNVLTIVLLHHLSLMVEVVLKFFFQGAIHRKRGNTDQQSIGAAILPSFRAYSTSERDHSSEKIVTYSFIFSILRFNPPIGEAHPLRARKD